MRSFIHAVLALALAASSIAAQGIGPIDTGTQSGPRLLLMPAVQKELGCTPAQSDQITRALFDVIKKYTPPLTQARKEGDKTKYAQLLEKMRADAEKSMDPILSRDQKKRLKQIDMQLGGVRTLSIAEVQTALDLSDKQKGQIGTLYMDLMKKVNDLSRVKPKNLAQILARTEQMNQLNKEATAKALSQLTEAQKKIWQKMTGKPFELKLPTGARKGRP